MNKFKKQFTSFISCVLTVVILMSTSSTLIYATENVVSQSSEQSEMVKNNIDKTEKSDEVVEDTVQKNEAKPNVESLNNNANEVIIRNLMWLSKQMLIAHKRILR